MVTFNELPPDQQQLILDIARQQIMHIDNLPDSERQQLLQEARQQVYAELISTIQMQLALPTALINMLQANINNPTIMNGNLFNAMQQPFANNSFNQQQPFANNGFNQQQSTTNDQTKSQEPVTNDDVKSQPVAETKPEKEEDSFKKESIKTNVNPLDLNDDIFSDINNDDILDTSKPNMFI